MSKNNLEQKVLVVDDERDIRRMVIRVVRSIYPKARIRQASNGRQAKEKIMVWCPDLVILDLHMPYMNGLVFPPLRKPKYWVSPTGLCGEVHTRLPHLSSAELQLLKSTDYSNISVLFRV